ncbi:hypothetical protein EF903_13205 [Streptomyces sp. WAC05292]|nr:hypothetical protein EF903_13205 [Streptomyces sp. WAC05292]
MQGRASAQRARSGPKAGASRGAEPGSPPGGAERSRVLDEVEKPVTARSDAGGLAGAALGCWHVRGVACMEGR